MSLRKEFEKEKRVKYQGAQLLIEANNNNYIKWLESKLEQVEDPVEKKQYKCTHPNDCRCERVYGSIYGGCLMAEEVTK